MSISEIKKIVTSREWLMTIPASPCEAKIDIVINKSHLMPIKDLMDRWGWSRAKVRWLLDKYVPSDQKKETVSLGEVKKSFNGIYGLEHIKKTKLTEDQYNTLIQRYGTKVVHEKITALEGSVHVNKKVDHYATLVNWINRDNKPQLNTSSYKDQAHIAFHNQIKGANAF